MPTPLSKKNSLARWPLIRTLDTSEMAYYSGQSVIQGPGRPNGEGSNPELMRTLAKKITKGLMPFSRQNPAETQIGKYVIFCPLVRKTANFNIVIRLRHLRKKLFI